MPRVAYLVFEFHGDCDAPTRLRVTAVTLTDGGKSTNLAVVGFEPVVLAPHADTSVTVSFASTALPYPWATEVSAVFLVGTDTLTATGDISIRERRWFP